MLDAVTQHDAITASRAPHQATWAANIINAAAERHNGGRDQRKDAVLGQHELARGEILSGPKAALPSAAWEYMLAIEVLMQAIVVILAIPQQQRRWRVWPAS